MPKDQRERLKNWRDRNGSSSETLRQQAAERGKVIHKLIEARFKGEEMECPLGMTEFWEEASKILGAIGEVSAIEQPVYHPMLQYAGTLDLLANWRGCPTLFDFKTSHREKRSQWLTDARLQIAAYRWAYECLYGLEIAQGLIMVITPNTVQLFTLEKEKLEENWQEWLVRLEQYQSFDLYGQLFSRKLVAKRFQRWVFHEILPSIRKTGSYRLGGQDRAPKALIAARAVNEINELVVDLSPRLAQYLIDQAVSEVLEQAALPGTTEPMRGVVEIAEAMGLPVNSHNRCQLGRFVKGSQVGHLALSETRLVNGTMREVYCYPDCERVRHVIQAFFG